MCENKNLIYNLKIKRFMYFARTCDTKMFLQRQGSCFIVVRQAVYTDDTHSSHVHYFNKTRQ